MSKVATIAFVSTLIIVLMSQSTPIAFADENEALVRIMVRFSSMENPTNGPALADVDANTDFRYSSINDLNQQYGLVAGYALYKHQERPANTYVLVFPENTSTSALIASYAADENVAFVEVDQPVLLLGTPLSVEPNDFWFTNTFICEDMMDCFEDTTHQRQWYLTDIALNAQRAWGITQGDTNQVIGLIDNAYDPWHYDLYGRTWHNWSELDPGATPNYDDDGDGLPDDFFGWDFTWYGDNQTWQDNCASCFHGTMMAGIFAAATDNEPGEGERAGVAGLTWFPKVLPCRIGSNSDVADALEFLTYRRTEFSDNIKVINMSLRLLTYSQEVHDRIHDAYDADILIVTGSGNYNNNSAGLPCMCDSTFCVACVNSHYIKTTWGGGDNGGACWGPHVDACAYASDGDGWNWELDECVDFGYPREPPMGLNTQSTALDESFQFCDNDTIRGIRPSRMLTSGGTAEATGVAALLRGLYPSLSVDQSMAMMRRGCISVEDENEGEDWEGLLGAGRLDAYRVITLWGEVVRDTTLAGEVWLAGDVMVGEDATLTIEAGAVIHVAPDAIDEADYQGQESSVCEIILQDGASLDIQGTSGDMVTIEGWSTSPEQGDWGGIIVDSSAADVSIEYLVLKHADVGIYAHNHAVDIAHSLIDSCGIALYVNAAGGTIFDVDATNCSDKGFYVSGSAESPALACAIFDSCRAENNNYGFYFGAYTDSCKVRNRCQANDNTLEGIYCESSMKIGPKVLCEDNGQNGLKLVGVGSASIVEGVKAVGHDNAAGCLCYNASNPEIKNCCFDGNYDDLDSKLNSYPILGDIGNSKGQNNSLINATRYNVANYKSGWIMMAEGCYWGPVEGEQYPDVSIYGSVDIDPWLTSDPGFSWRLPMWAAPRSNRPSVNYPNPFNAETRIIYNVARNGSHVDIRIYDVKGRLIKVLVNESKPAGEFTVAWDGRGQDGGIQASGVYFASVAIGKQAPDTRKLVLLK